MTTIYDRDLDKNRANYEALSPLSFLRRTAEVFPNQLAVIHGKLRYSYIELYERCRRLASALEQRGIKRGDTVAIMAPNTPAHLEAHFGIPATGAVINAINTRLDAAAIAFILEHGEAKILFTDREYSATVKAALAQSKARPLVIDIDDHLCSTGELFGEIEYEAFLASGDPDWGWRGVADEWDAISLGYTSGTTGNPKGVVTHHRGAYLNTVGNAVTWNLPKHPRYLWTLPMFHCDGWCFPWTITMLAGVHVCLRKVDPALVFDSFLQHGVTHFCGAPTVLTMLINAPDNVRAKLQPGVKCMTAGAAPPAAVLAAMEKMGFDVTHVYGLTEVYGPAVVCDWHEDWDDLPLPEKTAMKARQGVRYHVEEDVTVLDPQTLQRVPEDGETMGEIMFRGNVVMKGYLKNPKATQEAFAGGWFHSGDLGVLHPGGYMQIKDRSKDIIISGGENISTIEVEGVLYMHPDIVEAAVVARPDEHWGETPCAFVTLRNGANVTDAEIIAFCKERLAKFKVPRTVVFSELPKTSTGKIQKFELRERARALK
ncbi:acyl-CoA synthetase [Ferrovibrio terrae]|uniref:3-methylmercaptopropionyl-CoA ligase n=1 Tax=Ferrovibrio terrae TaxID=2594003 RepID=A0A516GXC0_9PROT|nr:acyl-CoA synthetase [Ferrovibrio terrae]QDO96135.1 acyl-CoA synthetase [Ferrovibrio terrae]